MLKKDIQLNIYNIDKILNQEAQQYEFVRFDSNNDCNLRCVYCHNHRSKDIIDIDKFRIFLERNVISVDNFQIGCIMEPTLDKRMCDFILMVANSNARPNKTFMIQTNGTLLHLHDYIKIRDSGLTHLYVSIDSSNPITHRYLRGGSNIERIVSNIVSFKKSCPLVKVVFITTVTSVNIHEIEELIVFGLNLGVKELYYVKCFIIQIIIWLIILKCQNFS